MKCKSSSLAELGLTVSDGVNGKYPLGPNHVISQSKFSVLLLWCEFLIDCFLGLRYVDATVEFHLVRCMLNWIGKMRDRKYTHSSFFYSFRVGKKAIYHFFKFGFHKECQYEKGNVFLNKVNGLFHLCTFQQLFSSLLLVYHVKEIIYIIISFSFTFVFCHYRKRLQYPWAIILRKIYFSLFWQLHGIIWEKPSSSIFSCHMNEIKENWSNV